MKSAPDNHLFNSTFGKLKNISRSMYDVYIKQVYTIAECLTTPGSTDRKICLVSMNYGFSFSDFLLINAWYSCLQGFETLQFRTSREIRVSNDD